MFFKYIKNNIDCQFDKDKFEMGIIETLLGYDNSDFIIAYRYKIDDLVSDFGYNVVVEDDKVKEIKMQGNKLYDLDFKDNGLIVEDIKESEMKSNAVKEEAGFIPHINISHVIFVVANDTVTMQFSSHTADRKQASFAGSYYKNFDYYYINSAYQNNI